jgi:hypothetical protein
MSKKDWQPKIVTPERAIFRLVCWAGSLYIAALFILDMVR